MKARHLSAFLVVLTLATALASSVWAQNAQTPLRVGGVIRPPTKLVNVDPVYPPIAISARQQGTVIIEATIGASGVVELATVLRSVPLLDEAALAAVYQWVFTPTLLNGVPTPIIYTMTVTFQLPPEQAAAQTSQPAAPPEPAAAAQSPTPVNITIADRDLPPNIGDPDFAVRVGGNIKPPVKVTNAEPVYPPIALAARKEGTVIVELTIGGTGQVADARVLRSVPLLDQAALDAVKQWTYVPTHLNGQPVKVIYTVTVTFKVPPQQ